MLTQSTIVSFFRKGSLKNCIFISFRIWFIWLYFSKIFLSLWLSLLVSLSIIFYKTCYFFCFFFRISLVLCLSKLFSCLSKLFSLSLEGDSVLDLACGKGGDLQKFAVQRVRHIVLVCACISIYEKGEIKLGRPLWFYWWVIYMVEGAAFVLLRHIVLVNALHFHIFVVE